MHEDQSAQDGREDPGVHGSEVEMGPTFGAIHVEGHACRWQREEGHSSCETS